jgi:hypothetical protein
MESSNSCLVPWREFAALHVPYTCYKDVVHFFEYHERFTFVGCDVVALPAGNVVVIVAIVSGSGISGYGCGSGVA